MGTRPVRAHSRQNREQRAEPEAASKRREEEPNPAELAPEEVAVLAEPLVERQEDAPSLFGVDETLPVLREELPRAHRLEVDEARLHDEGVFGADRVTVGHRERVGETASRLLDQRAVRLVVRDRAALEAAGNNQGDPQRSLVMIHARRGVVLAGFRSDRPAAALAEVLEQRAVELLLEPEDHRAGKREREAPVTQRVPASPERAAVR